eukprot:GHVS01001756.1.p1 GENE.GHVS01001756.1~~GHVS01001756.1.p1  ORF type:complete len:132 (+),score=11.55 GHVS01001756.1:200-595(+)
MVVLPRNLLNSLFDLVSHGNQLNGLELICALGVFCKGCSEEIIEIRFTNHQRLVLHEFGVDVDGPDELAKLTSDEIFASADADADGLLNIHEFNQWLHSLVGSGSSSSKMQLPLKCLLLSILDPWRRANYT